MTRRALVAAAIDVAAVILFVVIGRRSHHESGGFVVATGRVAAPFLIGLAVGWVVARAWKSPFTIVPTALIVWPLTVAAGMVLRHTAFHRGTAVSFIIVATIVLGIFLNGWRALAQKLVSHP